MQALRLFFVCSFTLVSPVTHHGRYQTCLQGAVRGTLPRGCCVGTALGASLAGWLHPLPLLPPPGCCPGVARAPGSVLSPAGGSRSHLCQQDQLEPCLAAPGCCRWALAACLRGAASHCAPPPPTSVNLPAVQSCSEIKRLPGSSI